MGKRESSTKSLFEEQATESNLVKVYLGDWYLNAGIVGFLKVLCEGDFEKLTSFGERLVVGENFIEFDVSILDGFKDKFYRQLFLGYFNKNQYISKINYIINSKLNVKKSIEELEKFNFQKLYIALGIDIQNETDFIRLKDYISEMSDEAIFDIVKSHVYTIEFIHKMFKKNGSKDGFGKKIDEFLISPPKAKNRRNKDICLCCQDRSSEVDFNNSISQIIGFNKDNTNWVWGFKAEKLRVCKICALMYLCASVGMIYFKSNYYFINSNSCVKNIFATYVSFSLHLKILSDSETVYKQMVKEVMRVLKVEQSKDAISNISFVEVCFNEKSSKVKNNQYFYNVYPFIISKKLAKFIAENLDGIPRGFYKIDKEYFDIEEEMLRALLERKLGYKDIDRLLRIYIKGGSAFSASKMISYALKYIQHLKGDKNVDLEKIGKKGFGNGKELREKLGKERENQINGLVYQLLNDLKVADKERFLDKYLRISMSNGMESRFGSDEMNDKDAFLQFGYSFVNGLMNTYTKEKKENENA